MQNKDEFEQYAASNYKKDEFSKYHASNYKKEDPEIKQPGWLERNANFAEQNINQPIESLGRSARDIAGGVGQGLANIIPGAYNLGASGINALGGNIPKSPMFDVVPHSPSATAGEIGSFFAGPGALKAITKVPGVYRTASSALKIPLIAEAIKHAGNVLGKSPMASRVAGNALLGGAYSPDNPLIGMGLGVSGGAAGDLVGKGYKGIKNSIQENELFKKTIDKFNPAAHGKKLEDYLSGGTNNITQNSRQLANDIRNAHNMREEESGTFFNHALKNAGHEPIYGIPHRDILPSKVPEYVRQQSTIGKIKELNSGDLFDSFKSEPTFENAHRLQSELGFMERHLKSNPLKTQDDLVQLKKVSSARQQLKADINKFLEKRDLTSNMPVGSHYKRGSELYEANVSPFLSDKKLLDIVKNGKTDIKNLHSVFDSPSNKITKEGIEKIGSINKIMKDLPESAKERILFSAIGGNKLSPEALLKKLDEIKSKGFESYFTPEVEKSMGSIAQKLKNTNRLRKVGYGAGAVGGLEGINVIKNMIGH